MGVHGFLDLRLGVQVGHHRKLSTPPEQCAVPAVCRDLLGYPRVGNNRKPHVREIGGLVGENTQVVVPGRSGARPQLTDNAASEPLPSSVLIHDQRPDLGDGCAERCELAACDDRTASVDGNDEAVDARLQFGQLPRQEMADQLIALNQLVDLPDVGLDRRPNQRCASTCDLLHVVTPAKTSLNAASSIPSARSSSASVIIRGGSRRMTVSAVRFTSTPCRIAASYTAAASAVSS